MQQDEFLKLFLAHEADLRAFIGALVADRHAREDVYQETVLTLWREIQRFDQSRSFGAWARGFATNKILKRRQTDARFPMAFSPEIIETVLGAFERTEAVASRRSAALHECLEQLPEKSRQLLAQRYEQDMKPADIARQSGRSIDAVYQALSRIRLLLEECIRRRLLAADASS
ncbi:MAG: sigma-70 family RNA polymerase sigma factor [Planctomycetota bacterium]